MREIVLPLRRKRWYSVLIEVALDPVLPRLSLGRLSSRRLPASVSVWDLRHDFGRLRQSAFDEGVEWGGCIRLKDQRLCVPHPVAGWPTGVDPGCDDTALPGYAGFLHVHLPDPATARSYVGFSALDYRATLADGDNLALVANGTEVFALVRTTDATLPRQVIADTEFDAWEHLYDDALADAGPALDAALWKVNREICRRLGFAFYRGMWGEPLVRVFRPLPRRI